MPNHVHLDMVPDQEDGLRAALGETHRHYTRHINFRQKWRGQAMRVGGQWPWSSVRAHLRGQDDGPVLTKPMLDRISDWRAYLSSEVESHQAGSIRRHTRTGRPLGTTDFIHKLEQIPGRPLATDPPGRKPSDPK
jgi:putative transposase